MFNVLNQRDHETSNSRGLLRVRNYRFPLRNLLKQTFNSTFQRRAYRSMFEELVQLRASAWNLQR